jgi:hypothetical protein
MEARVSVDIGTQKLEGNLSQARSEPDRMVSITDVGGIAIRQTLVGDRAWQMTQADTASRDMDADGIAALRNGFYTDVVHLLLLANDAKAVVFSKGQATIGTVRADAVVVRAPKQVERTYYIHPTTRRLIAFDQGEERVGAGVVARRTFSDFRAVGGIQWPHHEERLLNGESVMKVDVVSLRLNTGIPETAFSRR